jgi:hypothetical protein
MNVEHSLTKTNNRREIRDSSIIRLQGRWLMLARIAWLVLIVLILGLLIASILPFNTVLQKACTSAACQALVPTYNTKQYQAAGLSVHFVLLFSYVFTIFTMLAFITIGAVIFWLKSYDFIAFYTSFALVSFAMAYNSGTLLGFLPAWWLLISIISFLGGVTFGTFLYLFPNGRFVPRWMRWLVLGWVVQSGVQYFFPNSWLNNSWLIGLVFVGLLLSLLVAQVYRYRKVSNQLERQQTKWVVYGMSVTVICLVLIDLFYWNNTLSLFHPGPLSDLIVNTVQQLAILLVPLSIALSILRSRLWDIDIIIRSTLVYGSLTILLALLYFGLIFSLQILLQGLFHQSNSIAIVISTLFIYALFWPLRRSIQSIIDRRFYRRKYDSAKIIATFSSTLRNEVDLDTLREQLVVVVQETMRPAHVSLWLRPPTRQQASWSATPAKSLVDQKREISKGVTR